MGNGASSVPGVFSARNIDRPRWSSVSGSVRASSVITWVRAAWVIQVLLPVTAQSSPSRTARVRSAPRSDPVFGSVNTAVGSVSPDAIRGSHACFCASVPPHRISSAAISLRVASDPTPM